MQIIGQLILAIGLVVIAVAQFKFRKPGMAMWVWRPAPIWSENYPLTKKGKIVGLIGIVIIVVGVTLIL